MAKKKQTKAQELMQKVNAQFGNNTVRMASDPYHEVTYLPTGVLPMDILLGGGLPRGRFTEIFGDFSTLKSFVGLSAIASCQQEGGVAALVDTEHAFDPEWATSLGVDTQELIIKHPLTGEEAVDVTQTLVAEDCDLVVWDSVAATLPKAEANQRMGGDKTTQPARLAALMSEALRRINTVNHKSALLCINQTRMKVGIVFGNPESVPGGKSLPFYASYRVAMRKAGRITEKRDAYDGEKKITVNATVKQKIRCELLKSKLSKPDVESWFIWDLKKGQIDEEAYYATLGLEQGMFSFTQPKGSPKLWTVPGEKKALRGDDALVGWLEKHPKIKHQLRTDALSGS